MVIKLMSVRWAHVACKEWQQAARRCLAPLRVTSMAIVPEASVRLVCTLRLIVMKARLGVLLPREGMLVNIALDLSHACSASRICALRSPTRGV